MTAYRRVYDSHHLQADRKEPGSAPEPYTLGNRVWATFTFLTIILLRVTVIVAELFISLSLYLDTESASQNSHQFNKRFMLLSLLFGTVCFSHRALHDRVHLCVICPSVSMCPSVSVCNCNVRCPCNGLLHEVSPQTPH